MNASHHAARLRAMGFALCKLDPETKRPLEAGWPTRSLEASDFADGEVFGVIGGSLSNGNLVGHACVIVDLDAADAVARADEYMPATGMIEGRAGKLKSHRYYIVPFESIPPWGVSAAEQAAPAAIQATGHAGPFKKGLDHRETGARVIDFIGTGGQAVCPPALHPSGEPREWEGGQPGEAAVVPFLELWDMVCQLASACGARMPDVQPRPLSSKPSPRPAKSLLERASKYLAKITGAVSGCSGHAKLFTAARAMVYGFDLSFEDAFKLLSEEYNPRCEPPWSERELRHKIEDADRVPFNKPRGWLRDAESPSRNGKHAAAAGGSGSTEESPRPTIFVTTKEMQVNDEAIRALTREPNLYQRGGALVRAVQTPDSKTKTLDLPAGLRVSVIERATLREMLADSADWRKEVVVKEEIKSSLTHPPRWCVDAVISRGTWGGIRNLIAVVDHPVIRSDGSILTSPGYDSETELYLANAIDLGLGKRLTRRDAEAAARTLLNVVVDFPFADETDKSAWLAAVLTPFCRFAFPGPSPLFLADANTAGSGKGLLWHAASAIVTGKPFAVAGYSHDSTEMEKCITALAVAGDRMILLDNITGAFGNAALDKALTATIWRGRILGESRIVELPLLASWYASGNNVALAGDMPRRVILTRLLSLLEHPDERDNFTHGPDLVTWTRANRRQLLAAALTIPAAYLQAGCPKMKLTPFGSFEGWSNVVRSAIVWAGLPDPAANRNTLRKKSSVEAEAMGFLFANWSRLDPNGKGMSANEIIDHVFGKASDAYKHPELEDVRGVILEMLKQPTAQSLGSRLRTYADRIVNGFRLEKSIVSGNTRWQARCVNTPPPRSLFDLGGHRGLGGLVSTPGEIGVTTPNNGNTVGAGNMSTKSSMSTNPNREPMSTMTTNEDADTLAEREAIEALGGG